jgi:hypothetical protein
MAFDSLAARPGSAAEEEPRTQVESEETALPYTPGELTDDWEFKMIRSNLGLFGGREFRERILAEEHRAGWVLVEKFDDHQMRLKRLRKFHPEPEGEDYDPYRVIVDGPERASQARSEGAIALLAIVFVPIIIFIILYAFG